MRRLETRDKRSTPIISPSIPKRGTSRRGKREPLFRRIWLEPVCSSRFYLEGETINRTGRVTVAENGRLTTCDFRYRTTGFRSHALRSFPMNVWYCATRRSISTTIAIFTLKYLTVPIRDEIRTSFTPQVGRTEGRRVFHQVGIRVCPDAVLSRLGTPDYPGLFRVDLMQKKGSVSASIRRNGRRCRRGNIRVLRPERS